MNSLTYKPKIIQIVEMKANFSGYKENAVVKIQYLRMQIKLALKNAWHSWIEPEKLMMWNCFKGTIDKQMKPAGSISIQYFFVLFLVKRGQM